LKRYWRVVSDSDSEKPECSLVSVGRRTTVVMSASVSAALSADPLPSPALAGTVVAFLTPSDPVRFKNSFCTEE
jgi:hypothetical protein